MTDKINHTLTIPETLGVLRLDQALAKLLPDYSRTEIQAWIAAGHVLLNNKPAKAKTKISGGEIIHITAEAKPHLIAEAQAIPLTIVYEDDTILLINKPVGLVVHPGAGNHDQTLLNALLYHAPSLKQLPRAGIIHRLDKNTSGLLIIAKTPRALKRLSQQLKKRSLVREYQAIVYGKLISGGTVDAPIARHPMQRTRMAVVETGKPAITHYRVLTKFRAHTHLLLKLETGRTHQIRVHMAYIQHPLIGDAIYGSRVKLTKNMSDEMIHTLRQFKHQALHAYALGFTHPVTNEAMRFEAPIPEDMQALLQALQEDTKRNAS